MRLRPQEVLYDVGEEHPYIYLVRRGSVRVGFTDGRGRECLLAFCRPPDLLASVSAIVPPGLRRLAELPTGITKMRATIGVGRSNTKASALEATELERLDFRVMERLMGRHASWSIAVYNAMVLHALVKERRERELLTMTPEERYRQFLEDHDDLIGVVPQKDIAGYLGVTPVGLSRIATRVRNEQPTE
jgi:CRP-like cAMP-binding protein